MLGRTHEMLLGAAFGFLGCLLLTGMPPSTISTSIVSAKEEGGPQSWPSSVYPDLLNPDVPPQQYNDPWKIWKRIHARMKGWRPKIPPRPKQPIFPNLNAKEVLLIITGQAFRSGVSQLDLNAEKEYPCNLTSLDAQKEATISIVDNLVAPLEAKGATVTIMFSSPVCVFCSPDCEVKVEKAKMLRHLLEKWLHTRTPPEKNRQLISRPTVDGLCPGVRTMHWLWYRWVMEMRGGKEFDYMLQARHDYYVPAPITSWRGNFSKLLFEAINHDVNMTCARLKFNDPRRLKDCDLTNKDHFFWVPKVWTRPFRDPSLHLSFCAHAVLASVKDYVPASEMGSMLAECKDPNIDRDVSGLFCPQDRNYRPVRCIKTPNGDCITPWLEWPKGR